MTEAVLLKIGCVVAILVVYGLVRWRLMHATHEFRVRAGCDADQWVADERVPEETRRALQGFADGMYRPVTPWLVLLVTLIVVLAPHGALGPKLEAMMRRLAPDVREDIARLNVRLIFAAVTTSPLAGLAMVFVLLMGLLVGQSIEAVRKRLEAIAGTYPLRA